MVNTHKMETNHSLASYFAASLSANTAIGGFATFLLDLHHQICVDFFFPLKYALD